MADEKGKLKKLANHLSRHNWKYLAVVAGLIVLGYFVGYDTVIEIIQLL